MDTLLDFIKNNLMTIGGGALGGFLGLLLSYRTIGKILRMVRTSTSEIALLPAGEQVEIVGKADGETILHSPITKTPCVLWQVEVAERRSSGKSSHWVTVYSNTSTAPFDVYDGTGRMRVHPGPHMELLLRNDASQSSSLFSSLDEGTQAALNEIGVNTKGFLNLNKNMRVQERYIEQGDQIYLLGKTSSQLGARVMDANSPLIVSDQGKLRLLGRFSWQVVATVLVGVVVGVALALFFASR
ncbi:MAG: GIDE domain-containing protein [Chloroflexota bacterium]